MAGLAVAAAGPGRLGAGLVLQPGAAYAVLPKMRDGETVRLDPGLVRVRHARMARHAGRLARIHAPHLGARALVIDAAADHECVFEE